MTSNEDWQIVEIIEKLWRQHPHGILFSTTGTHSILFQAGGLRFCIQVTIGARGGLRQKLFIIDPSQHVVADRLVVRTEVADEMCLVDLEALRAELEQSREPANYLTEAFARVMQEYQRDPDITDLERFREKLRIRYINTMP